MLIAGILLGLLLGLRAGGRLDNLGNIQLRWPLLLVAAVIVRFGTEALLNLQVPLVEDLRAPLLALGFGLLLIALWVNRLYPGLVVAFVGILLNGFVILINGGYMPIWATSLEAAGLTPDDVTSALHVVVPGQASDFLVRALVLGDIIPIPLPIIQNVASLGDLFLTAGLAFFLFASVVRVPTKQEEREEAIVYARLAGLAASARLPRQDAGAGVAAETGLAPALQDSAALERPRLLGGRSPGLASPALAPLPSAAAELDLDAGGAHGHAPATHPGGAGTGPPTPVCAARPQRLVHVAVGRAADLAVRRPDPPARARRGRADHHGLGARDGPRLRHGDHPEPAVQPDRRHPGRSMGPQGGPRRQRPPARGRRAAHPDRHRDEHPASSTRSCSP